MGLFLIPAMNPVDLENDLLDYLRERYASEGLVSLVRLLAERAAEHESGTQVPFRVWLLELDTRQRDRSGIDRLATDLQQLLESYGGNARKGSRSGFVCY
ncbi:MAG: hypothetical protein JO264_08005 [Acidisphaera sp.]|nr:hypothetical protein [Acidisphaera sp.]